ncbi:protein root UVB sensitive 3-like isoform X1 [Gastrolobium bilobum]|uniref:protein root UVB sensitive 3-like isoform X1 n=1 Tax=Gastrolobium bilobum TaxID=150636 RepID=UPI002AB125B8|nr:protein root UVB sensitive 3-like isoform X1 [Gastrolobium bilobum]
MKPLPQKSSSYSRKTITLEEWNGSSSAKLSKTFTIKASSSSVSIQRSGARFTHVWRRLLQAFVPEGFPSSVTADYVPFQIWDSLQGLSTYIRTMLSTQALLSAIGVGEKSATVLGATFQWFLRDLTGMLGGILFTFYQGSNLDSNAKMWRLVADFMNDLGMLMDLISPLFPSAFVYIVCLGSISRSFTGVASGATRAALTQHFALQDNAADISAKEGSQETVATMIGMALGMLVARITIGHPLVIWLSFLSLTLFHVYANYQAVRCLALTSLNPERSSILLQHFMKTGQVLSPEQVSSKEHVLPIQLTSWSSKNAISLDTKVRLGMRISSFDNMEIQEHLLSAVSYYTKAKYLLVERKGIIKVIVHKDSNAADILKSFIHALVLANNVNKSKSLHSEGQMWMDNQYEVFIQKLKSLGWKTERLLSPIIWRANWIYEPLEEKVD